MLRAPACSASLPDGGPLRHDRRDPRQALEWLGNCHQARACHPDMPGEEHA